MSATSSRDILRELIGFDTTSRNSNLELMEWVCTYLRKLGVEPLLVHNAEGTKANLYATLGPADRSGVMLSGHTDVVPVDGQNWSNDPWTLTERDDRLYGRGTCDMKGFIAICLAYAPQFIERATSMPIHFAFSYDEEVGCVGVQTLIEKMKSMPIRPAMCIVGEPTDMQVVTGHKGKRSYRVAVTGTEAHSSLAPQAVNAVEYGARLVTYLRSMADRFSADGPFDDMYDVTHTTVHTGIMGGGTALNIVPQACEIEFEFRNIGSHDGDEIISEIRRYTDEILVPAMRAVAPETGIEITEVTSAPGLDTGADEDVVAFVKSLAERNDHAKVAFATEAGLFQDRLDIPTVICGPGSINQAHKPDEYVSLEQLALCERFMDRLVEKLS
ncbi:MAG: acetylornithine deacetylase [Rhodospirillales bacterium]